MPKRQTPYQLIQDENALGNFLTQCKNREWLALDTEFIREKTYYPQLCLVQVATEDGDVACIDTLAIGDISPLAEVLLDQNIQKVLHAGSQDMEIFCSLCGAAPNNVFDTQIAAPLFGYPEQMGYAALVKQRLTVSLTKTQSRTDWSARPLNSKQLRYAADDVIYLAQLYPAMRDELISKGRLDWLRDEFERLCDINTYQRPSHDAWLRIRGIDKLPKQALAIVHALAKWREETARKTNIPRNWLLKDDAIIDIARLQPGDVDDLRTLRGISQNMQNSYRETIISLVCDAKGRMPPTVPAHARRNKLTASQDALVDLLSAVAKLQAEQHEINHAILAPRKELEKLVCGDDTSRVLQGWRGRFVGDSLQQLLSGKLQLNVNNVGTIALTKT